MKHSIAGAELKRFRKSIGLTQREFIQVVNVSEGNLRNFETGAEEVPQFVHKTLLEVYGLDLATEQEINPANNLKLFRIEHDFSYQRMAEILGLSVEQYSRIEHGKEPVPLDAIERFADSFPEVQPDWWAYNKGPRGNLSAGGKAGSALKVEAILDFLKQELKLSTDTALAQVFDIATSSLWNWRSRNNMDYEKVIVVCLAHGIDLNQCFASMHTAAPVKVLTIEERLLIIEKHLGLK